MIALLPARQDFGPSSKEIAAREGMVMKSGKLAVFLAVGAIVWSFSTGNVQAGLFDFLRPKRPSAPTVRGQSPAEPRTNTFTVTPVEHHNPVATASAQYSSPPSWWEPAPSASSATHASASTYASPSPSTVTSPSTFTAAPTYDAGYESDSCFNCGEYDHCIWSTRLHRCKCGQTWYPRMAPYCLPGWGWTQPGWRRMVEEGQSLKAPSSSPPPLPAAEPPRTLPEPPKSLPEPPKSIPEPPPATPSQVSTPARSSEANRTASHSQKKKKKSGDQVAAPLIRPAPTRNAAFAEYLKLDPDAPTAKPAADKPLELKLDAATDARPIDKAVSGPELRLE
jgi:hypothetical protein